MDAALDPHRLLDRLLHQLRQVLLRLLLLVLPPVQDRLRRNRLGEVLLLLARPELVHGVKKYFFTSVTTTSALKSTASLSSPPAKRLRMYWTGVSVRCFSRCWKACCATYAMRRFGWRTTVPEVACSSPVRSLIAVDLPAPFAPITATRLTRDASRWMSNTVGVSRDGYWKVTSVIFTK